MTENERRTALKKNEIIRIYGTEFKENTVRLLREAELASLIPAKDARIGIKPNLVSASEASFGATTHPEIVAGIIEYLKEQGYEFKRLDEVDYYEKNKKSQNNSMIM